MKSVILYTEVINICIWVLVLGYSMLFLGAPEAKFSKLLFLFIPIVCCVSILILNFYLFKTNGVLILGLILSLILSAPSVIFLTKHFSRVQTSSITKRIPFVIPEGYTSTLDYLQKNENKEIQINGKVFIQDASKDSEVRSQRNGKLFVHRMPQAEIVVIELDSVDQKWNTKEVMIKGVLLKDKNTWFMQDYTIVSL